MKRILVILTLLVSMVSAHAANLEKYEKLYAGCVDNQESTIYGGTYGAWPKNLILPEFPDGGDVEFTRFIYHNLTYPEVVESYDSVTKRPVLATGVVAVQIVIDRCGRATRQEIIQSVNEEYDQEALRIMNGLPVFRAGEIDGIRVKVAFIVPVKFSRTHLPPKTEDVIDFDENYNFDDW